MPNFYALLASGKSFMPHRHISLQWLAFIQACQEPCSMTEVARKLDCSSAAVTGLSDALFEQKYISRSQNSYDRRKIIVEATKLGREYLKDAEEALQSTSDSK